MSISHSVDRVQRISDAISVSEDVQRLRLAIIKISTLRRKEEQVVEVTKERNFAVVGLCETRMNGSRERFLQRTIS